MKNARKVEIVVIIVKKFRWGIDSQSIFRYTIFVLEIVDESMLTICEQQRYIIDNWELFVKMKVIIPQTGAGKCFSGLYDRM